MGNKGTAAIEIGRQYIKIAATKSALRKSLGGFFCFTKPVASLDDAAISNFITTTFADLKLKPRSLALSLPRNLITVRVLSLPSDNPKEIAKMLDLHVVRLVPYKKEEMVMVHSILYTDEVGYTKIFLCIVHKDILKRYLKILADAGLFVEKIYASSYGVWEWILSNCKSQMSQDTIYLGVDVNFDYTELIAFSRQGLFFSRSIVIGQQDLGDSANTTKLMREVKQAMIFLKSEYKYKKPEKIFVSGAISELGMLTSTFEKELEIPAASLPLEPWLNKFKAKGVEIPKNISLTPLKEFLVDNPKRISFYVAETQARKALREEVRDLIVAGSLFIYVVFVICGVFLGRIYNRQVYLKTLQSYSKNIGQGVGELMQQSKRVSFIKEIVAKRRLPLLFFDKLHRIIPDQVAIKQINMDDSDKIILRGESSQLSDVFSFIGLLENNQDFKKVETKYTRKKKTREGEFTTFELSFIFSPSADKDAEGGDYAKQGEDYAR